MLRVRGFTIGEYMRIVGTVVQGAQRGRTIGFPTINVPVDDLSIMEGVYVFSLFFVGKENTLWQGVGTVITKSQAGFFFEGYVFGLDHEVYDEEVEVTLGSKIRGNQSFASLEDLQAQLVRDVTQAKELLGLAG